MILLCVGGGRRVEAFLIPDPERQISCGYYSGLTAHRSIHRTNRRALPLITRLARVAQPQAHHQTLLLRLGEILEGRPAVADLEVVHVLNLAALHDEIEAQRLLGEYI